MSADRLREAADVLEQPRDALGCSDPYECCLHSPTDEDTYPADRFETATAALLRAVAARHVSDSVLTAQRRRLDLGVTAPELRAFAASAGIPCPIKGRIPNAVFDAYERSHGACQRAREQEAAS